MVVGGTLRLVKPVVSDGAAHDVTYVSHVAAGPQAREGRGVMPTAYV